MNPFNLLPSPVLVTGPMGRLLFINRSFLDLVGASGPDGLGGPMEAFFSPSSQTWLQTHIWPNLMNEGHAEGVHLSLLDADKRAVPVLAHCQRQLLGDEVSFFWVFSVLPANSRFAQETRSSRHANTPAPDVLPSQAQQVAGAKLEQDQFTHAHAARLAGLGVWRNDAPDPELLDSRHSRWSVEMYALLDYDPALLTAPCISAYLARVHEEDRLPLLDAARQALLERRPWQTQYRLVRGDGTVLLVEEAGEFVLDAQGQVTTMLGVVRDITAQKKAELALALHRESLEALVKARTFDLEQSEQATRKFNRSLRMLSRCNVVIVHARDEHALLRGLCQHICEDGDFLVAWFGLMVPGHESKMVPVAQFGHPAGYLKLIQSRWAIEQDSGVGPICAALSTAKTQVSQGLWQGPFELLWQKAGQTQDPCAFIALPLWVGDQMLGVLCIHSQHMYAFAPEEIMLLEELARNIAFGLKTLRARKELDRYQQRLEDLVATRTAELSEAKNTADAANAAKGTFLATMSHELRTPLNAIIGLGGLLAGTSLTQRQRDYTQKIAQSGQTLCALIDDILDFSKIESREFSLTIAPFSMRAVLHATIELVAINLGHKPIETLVDVAADLPDALLGDALRLQQVLLNLFSNAIKFTLAGEITLSVRCVAHTASHATLKFAVCDTGIGIAPDKQARIFNEFTQANSSISRTFGGTGLGLAISSRLVGLMGAELGVRSVLGVGSEFGFTVTFPLGPAPTPAPTGLPPGLRVLIVDDHLQALALHAQNCHAFGWQPTAVSTGAAGLDELRRSAVRGVVYDVLLLDWRMPAMDGLEMLKLMHQLPGLARPRVILMVHAFELEQAATTGAELALDGLLAKPFGPCGLWQAVTRAYVGEHTQEPTTTEQPLSGLHLLVVEDNALNQEVIEQILTQAGATVVLASNGLAGVSVLRQGAQHFDAVLMDIEMPVMDGYSATRLIRSGLGLHHLPIIAVTARARPEDTEKSRLAGMVGHLVKPLNVKDLLALVGRVGRVHEGDAKPVPSQEPLPADDANAQWQALDITEVLVMFGGSETKSLEILKKFRDQHSNDISSVRQLLASGDQKGAFGLLHSLSGIAGFLQAKTLSQASSRAEEALHARRTSKLPDLLDAVDRAIQAVQADINTFEQRVARKLGAV